MEKMRFEGKVVIVTGASSGIGRSTARLFAMEGSQGRRCGAPPETAGRPARQSRGGERPRRHPAGQDGRARSGTDRRHVRHLPQGVRPPGHSGQQRRRARRSAPHPRDDTGGLRHDLRDQPARRVPVLPARDQDLPRAGHAGEHRQRRLGSVPARPEGRRDVRHNQARRARPDAQHLRFLLRARHPLQLHRAREHPHRDQQGLSAKRASASSNGRCAPARLLRCTPSRSPARRSPSSASRKTAPTPSLTWPTTLPRATSPVRS